MIRQIDTRWLMALIFVLAGCVPVLETSMGEQRQASQLIDQGTVFLRQGDLARARASFEVSRDLGGGAAALDGLGAVEHIKGNHEAAERHYLAALSSDPGYLTALGNLALLYEAMGRKEEAQNLYRLVLQLRPDDVRARNNYAAALYDDKHELAAVAELLRAEAVARHPVVVDNLRKTERVRK